MIDTIFEIWYNIIGSDTFTLTLSSFMILGFLFTFIDFWKQ
jgi:hypothetical protein